MQRLSALPGVNVVGVGGGNTPFAGVRNAAALKCRDGSRARERHPARNWARSRPTCSARSAFLWFAGADSSIPTMKKARRW